MIQPLGARVVVQMDPAANISTGGIHLPNDEPQLTGRVLAVGPGAKCAHCGKGKSLAVKVGDQIVLSRNTPVVEVGHGTDTYTIVNDADILGVLAHV